MEPLNEPQVWTLIGVFTAIMLGGMTLLGTTLSRSIHQLGESFDRSFASLERSIDARFDAVNARLDGLEARVGRLEQKVDHLDSEMSSLSRRFWDSGLGDAPPAP